MSHPERADTLASQRAMLDRGEVSAAELVVAAIDRVEGTRALNAIVGLRAEAAHVDARAADARIRAGELRSRLDGIPFVLKDNMVKLGEQTTCGSRILEGFVSPYDSAVV